MQGGGWGASCASSQSDYNLHGALYRYLKVPTMQKSDNANYKMVSVTAQIIYLFIYLF